MQMQFLAKQESSEIHAVGQQNMYPKRGSGSEGASLKNPVDDRSRRCYSCNRYGHFARDVNCPAKNQNCNLCGLKGHFSVCCEKKGAPVSQMPIMMLKEKKHIMCQVRRVMDLEMDMHL